MPLVLMGRAPWRVDVEARGKPGAQIFDAVGQRIGEFEVLRRAGFLHVVAGDRDRVELRHVLRGVLDDVADDLHRRLGRVDVGVAHHELFQNVVLNRSGELVLRHALLFGSDHITGQHRQHRAVHGHRDRHLVQRDLVEQDLHVLDRVDRHAGLAHIARHTGVVAVVAAVGGQVEGHRDALAAAREGAPVERVGLLGGREAGVLPDGPRLRRVHRRVGPAQERRNARPAVEVLAPGEVRARGDVLVDMLPLLQRSPRQIPRKMPSLQPQSLSMDLQVQQIQLFQ